MTRLCFVLLAILLSTPVFAAGDAVAGQAKAQLCAACHGSKGIAPNPLWPNLVGQQSVYLVKQIKAFRDGQRSDPMMAPMVAGLTDQDIENIAAYYSKLNPPCTAP